MPLVELPKIANTIGLSRRRINQLAQTRGFPRAKRGQYDLVKCVRWYIAYLRRQIDTARRGGDRRVEAENRKAEIQAELLGIKLAKERGEVINVLDVVHLLAEVLKTTQVEIRSIPKKLANELAQVTGYDKPAEIEQLLEIHLNQQLNELATIPDRVRGPRKLVEQRHPESVAHVSTAAKADRKRVGRRTSPAQSRNKLRARTVAHR